MQFNAKFTYSCSRGRKSTNKFRLDLLLLNEYNMLRDYESYNFYYTIVSSIMKKKFTNFVNKFVNLPDRK
jgi:hypothetical protein